MDTEPAAMAKSRKRPISRASTASIHSISTQPNLDQGSFGEGSEVFAGQWNGTMQTHAKDLAGGPHLSPDDAILQAASHLRSGSGDFTMDSSMDASMTQHIQYPQDHGFARRTLQPALSVNDMSGFTDPDSQMLDVRDDDGDSVAAAAPGHRSGASRTSANNEREMQLLFQASKHRSLQDVARELHGNERGPNSERQRQVFAMLWVSQVCSRGKGSVPRGRVYANYASRCATERITVLNPASFGKLVRVLFPGLKTRRLGVRGESKYHYVNFALIDDQPDLPQPEPQQPLALPQVSSFSQSFKALPAPAAAEKAPQEQSPTAELLVSPVGGGEQKQSRQHSLYNLPDVSSMDQLHRTTSKTSLELSFSTNEDSIPQNDPIILPRLDLYLPSGTDADAAKSLAALYRSHCTSLVECIRYCKEKTFFHLYTSFQGTLTMPVQKLLGSPNLAPWIEECDFILYQRMMRIVSGLTLQVVPKPVLDTLRNISERLVPHIRESFQGQPLHVIKAKEAPATIFAGLLDRALRVNLTAHAAANMLSNPANRDQMYHDWISMVRIRKVAECVPTRGMDDLVKLLLSEIKDLLDPVNIQWDFECMTIYGDVAARNGPRPAGEDGAQVSSSNALDRWVSFLWSLPARFPYASATEIVWCVQRVGTAVMRDLTLSQGKSFGSWWVTKCWVDEMVCFMAEQGGFMKQKPTTAAYTAPQPQRATKETSQQSSGSRYRSGSDEFNFSNLSQAPPDRAKFPAPNNSTSQDSTGMGADSHDDSGISIPTPEDELPMDKFGFAAAGDIRLLQEATALPQPSVL